MSDQNVTTQSLDELRERQQALQERYETALLESEVRVLERELPGLELSNTWIGESTHGDWVGHDPHRYDPDHVTRHRRIDTAADRDEGRDTPLFRNEIDLARIRGLSRWLVNEVAPASGILRNLVNYVIGHSWQYGAQAREEGEVAERIAGAVDRFVSRWLALNRWIGDRDREVYRRHVRDGEGPVRLRQIDESGMSVCRFVEPVHIMRPAHARELEEWLATTQPEIAEHAPLSWSFGVLTPEWDIETVLAYHVARDRTGTDWELIPSSEMQLYKAVTDSNVKRGVTEFYPVRDRLIQADKVFRNTAIGAAVQAAIAYVKKAPSGTQQSRAGGLSASGTRRQPAKGGGTREIDTTHLPPGSVITTGQYDYDSGPMGSQRNPNLVLAGQASLRLAATRFSMPEWMASGDASNNNLASSIVAESPFALAVFAEQGAFKAETLELLWKAVRVAYRAGAFRRFGVTWAELTQIVELTATPPSIVARDPAQKAATDQILNQMGAKSARTIAEEEQLDFDQERQRIQQDGDPGADVPRGQQARQESDPLPVAGGELRTSRLQFIRDRKAMRDILDDLADGEITRGMALELLTGIGLNQDRAKRIIDEWLRGQSGAHNDGGEGGETDG
jgi:hypothetical protein